MRPSARTALLQLSRRPSLTRRPTPKHHRPSTLSTTRTSQIASLAPYQRRRFSSAMRSSSSSSSSSSSPSSKSQASPDAPWLVKESNKRRDMLGVYVHWPYCKKICPYCDFNRYLADNKIDEQRMLSNYKREIEKFVSETSSSPRTVVSIFFGGGTPSLASEETIGGIINHVKKHFKTSADIEITMEANPTSFFDRTRMESIRRAGVNRLSLGIQSLRDSDLSFLGRDHTSQEAIRTIQTAKSIFPRLSFDLIYGRHENQQVEDWSNEIRKALQLSPSHLSAYILTIESNTPFYRRVHDKNHSQKIRLPNAELTADLYETTVQEMEKEGLVQYEVSNFSKPGEESIHNLNYWLVGDYIGIGPGAASRLSYFGANNILSERKAIIMKKLPQHWMERVEGSGWGTEDISTLSQDQRTTEAIMVGLRTRWGLSRSIFEHHSAGKTFEQLLNQEYLTQFQENGFVVLDSYGLRITQKGLILLDFIIPKLLAQRAK